MNTSLGALGHPVFRLAGIIAAPLRRFGLAVGVVFLLAACSALQLGYNRAPSLLYWWIDGHADLNDAQSAVLRRDIDHFLAWHRREELPDYAERMHQWRALAAQDLTADQVCDQVTYVHTAVGRLLSHGHEPLARLALTLSPAQLEHLKRHQAKGDEGFEKDFLRGSAEERLARRTERAVDRYETLYGTLSSAQVARVRQSLQASPFDAERSLQQRRERQSELLRLIPRWQAAQGTPLAEGAPVPRPIGQAMQDWLQRGLFPSPAATGEQAAWVRQGCQAFADLHNSTSPEQRRHAQRVLQDYEDDLRALAGAD